MTDPDRCPKCNRTIEIGDYPFCPHGRGCAPNVIDDTIIGGEWNENMGHAPVYYDSKSERRRLMKLHHVEEYVRHAPTQGSDRSPHTVDWSKGSMDAATLENAAILVGRQRQADKTAPPK